MNDYDDPYIMLAHHIISHYSEKEILRVISDDEFVYKLIAKELRGQDFQGPFLDTVMEDILKNKQRKEMCQHLDKLALYFFDKLDIDKLREKIIEYASFYHIIRV